MMKMHNPPHPGEIIKGLWLDPQGVSITEAAQAMGVSRKTLSKIVNGRGRVTPEIALRLSIALGSSAESWLGHQAAYDLWEVEQHRDEFHVVPLFATHVWLRPLRDAVSDASAFTSKALCTSLGSFVKLRVLCVLCDLPAMACVGNHEGHKEHEGWAWRRNALKKIGEEAQAWLSEILGEEILEGVREIKAHKAGEVDLPGTRTFQPLESAEEISEAWWEELLLRDPRFKERIAQARRQPARGSRNHHRGVARETRHQIAGNQERGIELRSHIAPAPHPFLTFPRRISIIRLISSPSPLLKT